MVPLRGKHIGTFSGPLPSACLSRAGGWLNGVTTMRRWRRLIAGLALAALAAVGCKQQCFLTECGFNQVQTGLSQALKDLECKPASICQAPSIPIPGTPKHVLDPERKPRYMSLAEAIAIALEQGTVNGPPGSVPLNDTGFAVGGGARNLESSSDAIQVLSLDPAVQASIIELSLSKFDARWNTSMTWSRDETPVGNAQQVIFSGGLQAIENQNANFSTGILKPLPTGGVAGITFQTEYQLTNLSGNRVNPAYRPTLQFQFEQPLLQGFGVEIQQLRSTHPGSQLNQIVEHAFGGAVEDGVGRQLGHAGILVEGQRSGGHAGDFRDRGVGRRGSPEGTTPKVPDRPQRVSGIRCPGARKPP